jgi:hypothetical protein
MRLSRHRLAISTLIVAGLSATSCGKKSSDSEGTSTGSSDSAAALILDLSNKIVLADMAGYSATSLLSANKASNPASDQAKATLANDMTSSYWTTASTIANMYCGGDQNCGGESQFVSPKDFFDDQLNKDFKTLPGNGHTEGAPVGVMARLVSTMEGTCAILYMLGSSGGLPQAQTVVESVTNAKLADANTFCGSDLQLPQEPLEVTITVKELTGQFSRHINLKSAAFENNMYLFDEGGVKRFMKAETSDEGDFELESRWFVQSDSNTKIISLDGFERAFITSANQGNSGGTLTYYRMSVDEGTKDVGVWGFYGNSKYISGTLTLNQGLMFAGRGNKDQTDGSIGFAELDSTAQNGSLRSGHPYVGCINMGTGAFTSGGACSAHALTAAEMETSLTMVKDKIMAKSSKSDWKFDETMTAPAFTRADMMTADPAY